MLIGACFVIYFILHNSVYFIGVVFCQGQYSGIILINFICIVCIDKGLIGFKCDLVVFQCMTIRDELLWFLRLKVDVFGLKSQIVSLGA